MIIELVVGDWSRDGHNQSESFTFNTNMPASEVAKAYKKGCEIVGFDLSKDIASDYEENRIGWDNLQTLRSFGLPEGSLDDETTPEQSKKQNEMWQNTSYLKNSPNATRDWSGACLSPETFCNIYLFIAKLGNPELEYKPALTYSDKLTIGGYGLFGN
jgi:hypothetical protein